MVSTHQNPKLADPVTPAQYRRCWVARSRSTGDEAILPNLQTIDCMKHEIASSGYALLAMTSMRSYR